MTDLNASGRKITNLADPTSPQDAATKAYVTSSAVSSVFGRTGAIVAVTGDYYGAVAAALTGATQASRYVGATTSGAPASGTFVKGDWSVAQDGAIFVCTTGGTPGTWAQVGSGASFATPSIALGSSAAGGAASTVIRSDATIAAFDATIPTTQAFGDAAAVGTAAFAARRDHKHAMPADPFTGAAAGGALDGTYPNPGIAAAVAGAGLAETSDVLSVNVDGSTIEINSDTLRVKDSGITSAKILDGTIASGDLSTALLASLIPWTVVRKGSDESVASSATVQDDDELFFTAASGTAYEIELFIIYVSTAGGGTPDIKIAFGEDSTLRGSAVTVGLNTADSSVVSAGNTALSNQPTYGTATTNRVIHVRCWHVGAGGTFKLQWSQATSGTNATVVKAGSVLRYRSVT